MRGFSDACSCSYTFITTYRLCTLLIKSSRSVCSLRLHLLDKKHKKTIILLQFKITILDFNIFYIIYFSDGKAEFSAAIISYSVTWFFRNILITDNNWFDAQETFLIINVVNNQTLLLRFASYRSELKLSGSTKSDVVQLVVNSCAA